MKQLKGGASMWYHAAVTSHTFAFGLKKADFAELLYAQRMLTNTVFRDMYVDQLKAVQGEIRRLCEAERGENGVRTL
jgi:hypothetical protein